jgi:hypothetical protein
VNANRVGVCPAALTESATAVDASEIADELRALLSVESVTDPMRQELRCRIADLHRRFPAAFLRDPNF